MRNDKKRWRLLYRLNFKVWGREHYGDCMERRPDYSSFFGILNVGPCDTSDPERGGTIILTAYHVGLL